MHDVLAYFNFSRIWPNLEFFWKTLPLKIQFLLLSDFFLKQTSVYFLFIYLSFFPTVLSNKEYWNHPLYPVIYLCAFITSFLRPLSAIFLRHHQDLQGLVAHVAQYFPMKLKIILIGVVGANIFINIIGISQEFMLNLNQCSNIYILSVYQIYLQT